MLLRAILKCCLTGVLFLFGIQLTMAQSGKIDFDFKIIDPTSCGQTDGEIHITPLSGTAPFQYSINGGASFQTDSVYTGLGIGTYILFMIDSELEFSSFFLVKLKAEGAPVIRGIVMTDPTQCGQGGTLKILTEEGLSNLEFSIDGGTTFQLDHIFSDVPSGTYDIVVKNEDETCRSTYPTIFFMPQPPSNFIEIQTVIDHPDCDSLNGILVIKATGGSGEYFYSIDNGMSFQAENTFENLGAGSYPIIIRDDVSKCEKSPNESVVLVDENCKNCDALQIDYTKVDPECGFLNGQILVTATGGSGEYFYSIDAGETFQNTPNFSNVAEGNYTLTVRDSINECDKNAAEIINLAPTNCPNCDSLSIQSFLTLPDCDFLNGRIELSITGGSGDYSVSIDGGDFQPNISFENLGKGTFIFTVKDNVVDCEKVFSAIELGEKPCDCALNIFEERERALDAMNCDELTEVCLDIPVADLMNLTILDNGAAYSGGLEGCTIDTQYTYLYFTLPGQGLEGPYRLDRWEVNDSIYTGEFQDIDELVVLMNTIDPLANWERDTSFMTLIGGYSGNSYGSLETTQISTDMMGVFQMNTTFMPNSKISLASGPHEILFRDTETNCTDTLNIFIDCEDCPEIAIVGGSQKIIKDCDEDKGTFCFTGADSLDLTGFSILDNGLNYTGPLRNCKEIGLGFEIDLDTGKHEILIFKEGLDCRFVFKLEVICPDEIVMIDTTIFVGDFDTICFEELLMLDSIKTIQPICEGQSPAVGFEINNLKNCLYFEGLQVGMDTICIAVCENDNSCTEVILTVTVLDSMEMDTTCQPIFSAATAMVEIEDCAANGQYCLNLLKTEMTNYTLTINGTTYNDNYADCDVPEQASLELPIGIYELILTENEGECSDTTTLTIVCNPEMDIFEDTVRVNETDTFCIDSMQLAGNMLTIENVCPSSSGEMVVFEVDTANYCIYYTGIEEGIDTACIEVCDNLGTCDTTIIIITTEVPDTIPFPIAVNDFDTLEEGSTRTINVLGNDTTNSTLITVVIIDFPKNGFAFVNQDMTITYTSEDGICDTSDIFTYELCNPRGCDTATVELYSECKEFLIFTGFSPNGDDVNETFTIKGIEDFPNNHLQVFNRWGNVVYDQKGYKGQWNGTWNDKLLPDGTYFYILDDGVDKTYSGFLEIHR